MVTLFVLKDNYLVTIISLTYFKRLRLESSYGSTILNNHDYRKLSSEKGKRITQRITIIPCQKLTIKG